MKKMFLIVALLSGMGLAAYSVGKSGVQNRRQLRWQPRQWRNRNQGPSKGQPIVEEKDLETLALKRRNELQRKMLNFSITPAEKAEFDELVKEYPIMKLK